MASKTPIRNTRHISLHYAEEYTQYISIQEQRWICVNQFSSYTTLSGVVLMFI